MKLLTEKTHYQQENKDKQGRRFLMETIWARRQWDDVVNVCENKCQPGILYPANVPLKKKIKFFTYTPNKTSHYLQIHTTEMLKKVKES